MELCRIVQHIPAPASALWALVSDFENPQRLSKTIDSCEVRGQGLGAIRVVKARGLTMHGRLIESDPVALRFAYDVLTSGDMPAPGLRAYRMTVEIRPTGEQSAEVAWTCEVEREPGMEGGLERIAAGVAGALKNLETEALQDAPSRQEPRPAGRGAPGRAL
jgi:carbon monoxide dehydrogenase subunit G